MSKKKMLKKITTKETLHCKNSKNYKFLRHVKVICSNINNCLVCDSREHCETMHKKKYINLSIDEFATYLKQLNSCEKNQGNYCVGCKQLSRCHLLHAYIVDNSTSLEHNRLVEFDGIPGTVNPCVEGYEESVSRALENKKGRFGLPYLYSNSGISFNKGENVDRKYF